jgi:hypothetical protein
LNLDLSPLIPDMIRSCDFDGSGSAVRGFVTGRRQNARFRAPPQRVVTQGEWISAIAGTDWRLSILSIAKAQSALVAYLRG